MPDALIWPLAAVICIVVLGIVAIFALRPALLRLVDRTAKIGRDGAVFEPGQDAQKSVKAVATFDELIKAPVSPTILDREENIRTNLSRVSLKNDAEKIAILIKASAVSRVEMEFLNMSNLIFGSQLNLLVQLAGTPQGVSFPVAEAIFKQAQAAYPDLHGNHSFDEWLHYLVVNMLVASENNKIDITQYAKDFLKYLIDSRRAYQRHG